MARQRQHMPNITVQEQHPLRKESGNAPVPYVDVRRGATALSRGNKRSNRPFTSFACLPLELIYEVLRASAESLGATDPATVNSITRTCRRAYTIALPSLYRAVFMHAKNYDMFHSSFFDEHPTFTEGVLREPAVHRLCPLVKHLVLRVPNWQMRLTPDHFSHFIRLSSVFIYAAQILRLPRNGLGPTPAICTDIDLPEEMPSLTCIYYDDGCVRFVPPSVTHASFNIGFNFNGDIDAEEFDVLTDEPDGDWPPTITHVSLKFCQSIRHVHQLSRLLKSVLQFSKVQQVVVHLVGPKALSNRSYEMAIRGIYGEYDERVRLWLDYRRFNDGGPTFGDAAADAYADRTPWTEARALTDEEIERAVMHNRRAMDFYLSDSDFGDEDDDEEEDEGEDEDENEEEDEHSEGEDDEDDDEE